MSRQLSRMQMHFDHLCDTDHSDDENTELDYECIYQKMLIEREDVRTVVRRCSQIKVDFLPDNNLKLPRFIQIIPIPLEEALFHVFPDDKPRLNLSAVFAKFQQTSVGAVLKR